ncbi:flavodoxin family protein [Desulfotomaculum sp. 1211_IL3151]|uniref:flavodoxin family protein n=1 Tax=Desulfotomaculum sp. 1211_IL3151 TaxID=3084055 RepID=UPI002FDA09CD
MKIVVINGSPKGRKGNTNVIVSSLLKGAEEAGAQTTNLFLTEKNIHPCTGCTTCWFAPKPGQCVIKDDMFEIIAQLGDANVIILATPVYCENMTSLLKMFIDRLTMVANPYSYSKATPKDVSTQQQQMPPSPKLMMISTCGFPNKENFEVLAHWYQRFSHNMRMESLGEIYVTRGKYLMDTPQEISAAVAEYLLVVENAGREIATKGQITEKTKKLLDTPFATA